MDTTGSAHARLDAIAGLARMLGELDDLQSNGKGARFTLYHRAALATGIELLAHDGMRELENDRREVE